MMLLLLACSEPEPVDSAEPEEEEVVIDEGLTCDVLEIRVGEGPEEPHVGDSWTILLYCDDVVLLGTGRVSFDPVGFGSNEDNVVTFLQEGDGTVTLQMGNKRGTRDVTVLP